MSHTQPVDQGRRSLRRGACGLPSYVRPSATCSASIRHSAEAWFLSDRHTLGSFRWVCDELELDTSWLRRRLLELAASRRSVAQLHSSENSEEVQRSEDEGSRQDNARECPVDKGLSYGTPMVAPPVIFPAVLLILQDKQSS